MFLGKKYILNMCRISDILSKKIGFGKFKVTNLSIKSTIQKLFVSKCMKTYTISFS